MRLVLWLEVAPLAEGHDGVGLCHDGATVVCRCGQHAWCSGWQRRYRQKGHGGALGVRHECCGSALRQWRTSTVGWCQTPQQSVRVVVCGGSGASVGGVVV